MEKLGDYLVPDTVGPKAPKAVSVAPEGWTSETTVTVTWSDIADTTGTVAKAQIKVGDGAWKDIGTNYGTASSLADNPYRENLAGLQDGEYTISIRGVDNSNNAGSEKTVKYRKDTHGPEINIIYPEKDNDVLNKTKPFKAVVNSADGMSDLKSWELSYAYGTESIVYTTIASADGVSNIQNIDYIWSPQWLALNAMYSLRLTAEDEAGNKSVKEVRVANLDMGSRYTAHADKTPASILYDDIIPNKSEPLRYTAPIWFAIPEGGQRRCCGAQPRQHYVITNIMPPQMQPGGAGIGLDLAGYDEAAGKWKYPVAD
jgi:hypothetical protein